MTEVPQVLAEFDEDIASESGAVYRARALGLASAPGHWEGWLEFTPVSGGGVSVDTDRETTQPNRADLLYWVTGLTRVYLQGALARALESVHRGSAPRRRPSAPHRASPVHRAAVLDPFAVYAQGEHLLRQELLALSVDHLEAILYHYGLEPRPQPSRPSLPDTVAAKEDLAERIIAGVRRQAKAS